MLVMAAYLGWAMWFFDVSRAFLHTSIKDPFFAETLEKHATPTTEGVWEMTESVYCLEEAPADLEEHRDKVPRTMEDKLGPLNLKRQTSEVTVDFDVALDSEHDMGHVI